MLLWLFFAANKTPGLDGYSIEWYPKYAAYLPPRLLSVYCEAQESGILLDSMWEALMVLIPKPNKDPRHCESHFAD